MVMWPTGRASRAWPSRGRLRPELIGALPRLPLATSPRDAISLPAAPTAGTGGHNHFS